MIISRELCLIDASIEWTHKKNLKRTTQKRYVVFLPISHNVSLNLSKLPFEFEHFFSNSKFFFEF